ncbi:right-handed parallel beta-helix repeat-containing protein (plasmid) [Salipiger sp. H15]|uniref:Right-handed parallel beta-helix repeat-containing protein n=1 Tax=Alloyangia sp. H15 TaxID=3029062 RepID=A0AAU8AQI0_9RHOB
MIPGPRFGAQTWIAPAHASNPSRTGVYRRRDVVACLALTALVVPVAVSAQDRVTEFAAGGTPDALDVSGPEELRAALARARGGEVILLAPGDYGSLELRGTRAKFDDPVTLRSADPAVPARFDRIALRGARNLVLERLEFRYRPEAGDGKLRAMLEVRGAGKDSAGDITVRDCRFVGELVSARVGADLLDAEAVAAKKGLVAGSYAGMGIYMQGAEDITVTGNEVTGVYRGFSFEKIARLEVSENLVHDIRSDGMTFGQLEHARIERNTVRDLHPWRHSQAQNKGDHPDLMQFWTTNSDAATRDVVVRGNLLVQRAAVDGDRAQGIFMRNSKAEADAATDEFFFRDIVIEDNVILNGHINSLVIGETIGLAVVGNLVLQDPGAGTDRIDTPILSIARRSAEVTVSGNVLPALSLDYSTVRGYAPLDEGAALGWQVAGNSFTRRDPAEGTVIGEDGAALYHEDKVIAELDAAMSGPPRSAAGSLAQEITVPGRGNIASRATCTRSEDGASREVGAGCL